MIVAQILRLRLFDERQAEILFGPDVLRNLAAIVAAPLLYYVWSPVASAHSISRWGCSPCSSTGALRGNLNSTTALLVSLFALWNETRVRSLLVLLAPAVALYAARSYSTLAIALVAATAALFAAAGWREKGAQLCALIMAVASAAAGATEQRLSQAPRSDVNPEVVRAVPGPLQTRLNYWKLYAAGITESVGSALFGHRHPIERSEAPSAHNYYLDFVYNFGLLAFLPFAWLVWYTLALLWRARARLRELPILGLAAALLFVLAVDNMFKVPLRQPYPGVFFFFLWRLLLAQLQARDTRAGTR